MVEAAEVRRLALALAGVADESTAERLVFSLAGKGVAWTWNERVEPKRPRRPRLDVLAVRCELERKEMLIAARPAIYFDEPHYLGFPAVLVRLPAIDAEELAHLLAAAHALRAPKRKPKTAPGLTAGPGARIRGRRRAGDGVIGFGHRFRM
jgi:hypothetical protein